MLAPEGCILLRNPQTGDPLTWKKAAATRGHEGAVGGGSACGSSNERVASSVFQYMAALETTSAAMHPHDTAAAPASRDMGTLCRGSSSANLPPRYLPLQPKPKSAAILPESAGFVYSLSLLLSLTRSRHSTSTKEQNFASQKTQK